MRLVGDVCPAESRYRGGRPAGARPLRAERPSRRNRESEGDTGRGWSL